MLYLNFFEEKFRRKIADIILHKEGHLASRRLEIVGNILDEYLENLGVEYGGNKSIIKNMRRTIYLEDVPLEEKIDYISSLLSLEELERYKEQIYIVRVAGDNVSIQVDVYLSDATKMLYDEILETAKEDIKKELGNIDDSWLNEDNLEVEEIVCR